MKLGSDDHKQLFCRQFIDTHLSYEPETLPWMDLDKESLAKLRAIPFWRIALMTEQSAGMMVSRFAQEIDDPLIREAIALQGYEETRHGRLMAFLIDYYGITIEASEPSPVPNNIESAFIEFGFEECLDSFFAFGMFGIAQQAHYLPEFLFKIFDPVLDEEARHIIFFVNWITYRQIQRGQGLFALRGIYSFVHYSKALWKLATVFKGDNNSEKEEELAFTATGASNFLEDLTPKLFLKTCLAENQKRMSKFDPQLLQPQLLPRLSQMALNILT